MIWLHSSNARPLIQSPLRAASHCVWAILIRPYTRLQSFQPLKGRIKFKNIPCLSKLETFPFALLNLKPEGMRKKYGMFNTDTFPLFYDEIITRYIAELRLHEMCSGALWLGTSRGAKPPITKFRVRIATKNISRSSPKLITERLL